MQRQRNENDDCTIWIEDTIPENWLHARSESWACKMEIQLSYIRCDCESERRTDLSRSLRTSCLSYTTLRWLIRAYMVVNLNESLPWWSLDPRRNTCDPIRNKSQSMDRVLAFGWRAALLWCNVSRGGRGWCWRPWRERLETYLDTPRWHPWWIS